jgi:hypothetical protein
MLLLTSDWSQYHHRLDVLFANSWSHPSGPASSCVHPACLYADVLCLLTGPFVFEDPRQGFPIAAQTRCWLYIIAATGRF